MEGSVTLDPACYQNPDAWSNLHAYVFVGKSFRRGQLAHENNEYFTPLFYPMKITRYNYRE